MTAQEHARQMLRHISFYWNRLRRERLTRALGVSVLVFAMVAQAASVFVPAPAAHATSVDRNDNIIYQGAKNKTELLGIYDQNRDAAGHTDIQAIYSRIGITRADLANATEGTYYTDDFNGQLNSLGRLNFNVGNRTQLSVPGASTTIYTGGYLQNYNHIHYAMTPALIGHRAVDGQWFAITLDCGNAVYVTLPPAPVKNISVCRGGQVITIKETDKQSGDLAPDSPQCQPAAVACKNLTVSPVTRDSNGQVTTANFTTSTTATNATLTKVEYVIKDAQGNEISRSTDSSYKPTQPGTYTVQAVATFNVKGETKTVTDQNCQAQLVVPAENQIVVCRNGQVITIKQSERQAGDLDQNDASCHPKPPVTTTTTPPAELPHTGPADTFVSALGLALMAGAGYYYWDSRRLVAGNTAA